MTLAVLNIEDASQRQALQQALQSGAVVVDGGRRRPFYFDGRFLTAADLTADQNYIRARQSDLAQAIGSGVIRGLTVSLGGNIASNDPELVVQAGLGVTPAGDLVRLADDVSVRLNALPQTQIVDAQLGVKLLQNAAINNRTGVFLLALRPIEFSANPVAAYPTTLDGQRTVRDGDIIEATALTLIPYPDRSGSEDADAKRARIVREIFFEGRRPGVLQEALPLALMYLSGGRLVWLDMHLVRREVGAESTLAAGLNARPRALLEAWFKQHSEQIDDLPAGAVRDGFAATRYFDALPPVGLLPASALRFDSNTGSGRSTLLQSFFPAVVDCEFGFIPADEVASLVDGALGMPPIDLTAADDDLDQLSVMILAPVTRSRLTQLRRELDNLTHLVRPAAPGMLAKRLPLEALIRVTSRLPASDTAEAARLRALDAAWRKALADAQNTVQRLNRGCFWFVRKRQLPYFAEVSGATVRLAGNPAEIDSTVNARFTQDTQLQQVNPIVAKLPRLAQAEAYSLIAADRLRVSDTFGTAKLATSDLLRRGVIADLMRVGSLPTERQHAGVMDVARRYTDAAAGTGYDAMRQAGDDNVRTQLASAAVVQALAASGVAAEIDRAARSLPPDKQGAFAQAVVQAATGPDTRTHLRALVAHPSASLG